MRLVRSTALLGTATIAIWALADGRAQAGPIRIERVDVMEIPDPNVRNFFDLVFDPGVLQRIQGSGPTNSPNPNPDFITIYDIDGMLVGTNRQPDNWRVRPADAVFLGPDPAGVSPPFVDDPTILNITWGKLFDDIVNDTGAPIVLGRFSIQADVPAFQQSFRYGSQTTLPDGTKVADFGEVFLIPEPSTLALVGVAGLAGLVGLARRRVRA